MINLINCSLNHYYMAPSVFIIGMGEWLSPLTSMYHYFVTFTCHSIIYTMVRFFLSGVGYICTYILIDILLYFYCLLGHLLPLTLDTGCPLCFDLISLLGLAVNGMTLGPNI